MIPKNKEDNFSYLTEKRDPLTERKHRKEVFWQITVPLLLGVLVLLLACILPVFAVIRGGEVSTLADTALMWLIIIAFIIALIPLALLGGLAIGVTRLMESLPPVFFRIQRLLKSLNVQVSKLSDQVVKPIIRLTSLSAGFRSGVQELSRSRSIPRK